MFRAGGIADNKSPTDRNPSPGPCRAGYHAMGGGDEAARPWGDDMDMTDAQLGACTAIVRAPEAWSRWGDVEAAWGADALDALVRAGVLVAWARPDYAAVTLSPWGAWLLGVQLDEVWRSAIEVTIVQPDPARPLVTETTCERVMVETPRWAEGEPTRPIVLPRFGRIGRSLINPDSIAAPEEEEDGPEYLLDDEGEEVKLFGESLGGGWPIVIDRRLTG